MDCKSSKNSKVLGRTEYQRVDKINQPNKCYQTDIIDLLETVENKDDNLTEAEEEHEEWWGPTTVLVLKINFRFFYNLKLLMDAW